MLENYALKSYIPTTNLERAKNFYCDVLGLILLHEDKYALNLDADGTILRINYVPQLTPHPFTILGWEVMEIEDVIKSMQENGIEFKRFDGIQQDEAGIWIAADGSKVAWFNDPDGNILSLTE